MSRLDALAALMRAAVLGGAPSLLAAAERRRPELASGPVVTRDEYRANFAAWNDLGLDLPAARHLAMGEAAGTATGHPQFSFGLSTGTLGEPGVFITSARDRSRWLGTFFARVVPPELMIGTRAAVLLRHNNPLYHQTKGRTVFFGLADGAEAVAAGLGALRPQILVGPPFALRRIVESQAFRQAPWAPRLVIVGGEPLWPEDEAVLRDGLGGAPVRQVYQAAEGFFGASCRHGRLHLNTDVVRVDAVRLSGVSGRFVPVVTDLVRDGPQRIVRYRTDDLAVERPDCDPRACPCGSALPAVAGIEGRLADVLVLPPQSLLFPGEVHAAVAPELGGAPFRVVQEAVDGLALEVPAGLPAAAGRRAAESLGALAARDGPGLVRGVAVRTLVLGDLAGKFRRVVGPIQPDGDGLRRRLQEPTSWATSARKAAPGR